jgi:hypothetical protein
MIDDKRSYKRSDQRVVVGGDGLVGIVRASSEYAAGAYAIRHGWRIS